MFITDIKENGAALILTILVMSIMLSISLSLAAIFIPKIKQSADAKKSVNAIYAAESAIEWCLRINNYSETPLPPIPTMSNNASYYQSDGTTPIDSNYCNTPPLKIIGLYQNVSRVIEVNF